MRTIEMVETKKTKTGKQKITHISKFVAFPHQINSYLTAYKDDFTSQNAIAILNNLYGNEVEIWDDIKFSKNDIEQLLALCDELLKNLENITDYSIFEIWKSFGINKRMLQEFAVELSELLSTALANDKQVYSLGD